MNKKHLALIGVVIALLAIGLSTPLFQTMNSNQSSEIEKANAFQIQLQSLAVLNTGTLSFVDLNQYNSTIQRMEISNTEYFTEVSKDSFLTTINQYLADYPRTWICLYRIDNTFYQRNEVLPDQELQYTP